MNKYEKDLIWHLDNNITYYLGDCTFKLSEQFIRDHKNLFDCWYLSFYQNLSEEFIKEFQDKVNWRYISGRQKLSKKFIEEFYDKVYCAYIPLCLLKINNEHSWRTFL